MAPEENKSHLSRPIPLERARGLASPSVTISTWAAFGIDRGWQQPGEFNESQIILPRTATFLCIAGTDPTKRNIVLGNHSAHSDETSLT